MKRTLDEIRREGLAALKERLGRSGMLRFLSQFESGVGNYARERCEWADETTVGDIKQATRSRRRQSK